MKTVSIEHKSRPDEVIINYPETENVMSWPATFKDDGEIYEVELTNVATYAIAGVQQNISANNTYPVTASTSYGVSITKVINGLSARVVLRSRRAVPKSLSISVPDFGTNDGRWLYLLFDDNTIKKLDCDYLISSNYEGNGVFTSSPDTADIILPLPADASMFNGLCFIVQDGVQKFLVAGKPTISGSSTANYCIVKVSDNRVFDFSETTENSSTQLVDYVLNTGALINMHYDYVSQLVYVAFSGATTQIAKIDLDTKTKSISALGENGLTTSKTLKSRHPFIPTTGCFGNVFLQDFKTGRNTTGLISVNANSCYSYDRNRNYIMSGAVVYGAAFWDMTGVQKQSLAMANVNNISKTINSRLFNPITNIVFNTALNSNYPVYAKIGGASAEGSLPSIPSGQTGFALGTFSERTNLFFNVGRGGDGGKRLYIFEPDIVANIINVRYMDFAKKIVDMQTTQLV